MGNFQVQCFYGNPVSNYFGKFTFSNIYELKTYNTIHLPIKLEECRCVKERAIIFFLYIFVNKVQKSFTHKCMENTKI